MNDELRFRAYQVVADAAACKGEVVELALADLSPGEVLVQAAWSSVNYKDALAATGQGRIIRHFPMVPGIDVAGVVVRSEDSRYPVGSRVLATGFELGTAHTGGYADLVRVPGDWVVAVPAALTLRDAMLLGTAGFTMALCMERLEANGQQPALGPLLVSGATGGVGGFCIDVLSQRGFEVIALTAKAEAETALRQRGASSVWLRESLTPGQAPLEPAMLGGGIDNLGGEVLGFMLRSTRPWGNVVSVGLAESSGCPVSVLPFILRGVALLGVSSANCPVNRRTGLWQRLAGDLRPRSLAAMPVAEVELEELPQAFAALLEGRFQGRHLVRLGDAGWRASLDH